MVPRTKVTTRTDGELKPKGVDVESERRSLKASMEGSAPESSSALEKAGFAVAPGNAPETPVVHATFPGSAIDRTQIQSTTRPHEALVELKSSAPIHETSFTRIVDEMFKETHVTKWVLIDGKIWKDEHVLLEALPVAELAADIHHAGEGSLADRKFSNPMDAKTIRDTAHERELKKEKTKGKA